MSPRKSTKGRCFRFFSWVKKEPLKTEDKPLANTPFLRGLDGFADGLSTVSFTTVSCSSASMAFGISLNLFANLFRVIIFYSAFIYPVLHPVSLWFCVMSHASYVMSSVSCVLPLLVLHPVSLLSCLLLLFGPVSLKFS